MMQASRFSRKAVLESLRSGRLDIEAMADSIRRKSPEATRDDRTSIDPEEEFIPEGFALILDPENPEDWPLLQRSLFR
jgi:hypothetical protein